MYPVHALIPHLFDINFNIISPRLRLGFSNGQVPSVFTISILYAGIISPMRATFPTHQIIRTVIQKARRVCLYEATHRHT